VSSPGVSVQLSRCLAYRLDHARARVLSLLASNKKVICTSRPLNFQCQACLLGKSSCLSLGPMSHQTSAPLELVFSDV
jgi:hypothetical protein